jgi:hypothetical protein
MAKTLGGAKIYFKVNGATVAWCKGISYEYNVELLKIDVIDSVETIEFAENSVNITFTASMFRIFKQSAVTLGLQPKLSAILSQPDLLVTIHDKTTDEILFTLQGVKLVGRSGNIEARSVWTETLTFWAKSAVDEGGE